MKATKEYRSDPAVSREAANHARRLAWIRENQNRAREEDCPAELLRFQSLLLAERTRHEAKLRRLRAEEE